MRYDEEFFLQECELCHDEFPIREIVMEFDNHFYCRKCYENRQLEKSHIDEDHLIRRLDIFRKSVKITTL